MLVGMPLDLNQIKPLPMNINIAGQSDPHDTTAQTDPHNTISHTNPSQHITLPLILSVTGASIRAVHFYFGLAL